MEEIDRKLVVAFEKVERELWNLRIAIMLVLCVALAGVGLGFAALIRR